MPLTGWSFWIFSFTFILLLNGDAFAQNRYVGDSCSVNGSPGVCRILPECNSVYTNLLAGNPPGEICGYAGFNPIVCCPSDRIMPTPRPTTQRPTPRSTPRPTRRPMPGVTLSSQPVTMKSPTGSRGIAREKCAEYARSVYGLELPPTLLANRKPINMSRCAIKTRKLIVGGVKADPKEFPHMTAVGFQAEGRISWDCGGTLISERFVLTAAHCTYSPDWGRPVVVRVGDLNLIRSDDDAKPRDYRILDAIRHPRYKRPSQYHDIALLRLETDVEFDAWVRPACLPYSQPDRGPDNKAVATGWGLVDWGDDEGSTDLLKVTLKLVDQPRCNASFVDGVPDNRLIRGIVEEWQICAGELGKDTCQGDSGGPLAIFNSDHNCMYTVIGVTSIGKVCASIDPGVYTRVYHYVPWIESVVWPDAA